MNNNSYILLDILGLIDPEKDRININNDNGWEEIYFEKKCKTIIDLYKKLTI